MLNRLMFHWTLLQVLCMAPDVNSPGGADIPGEAWPEGELPAQGRGAPTLMPAQTEFILPATIAQLWSEKAMKDSRKTLANGAANPTFDQMVNRQVLKFDKNNPLVVASGPLAGQTMTGTVSTQPRPRGKMDDPKTPWISDAAYMLEIGLNDKSRPTTADALKAKINAYAGKTVRIDHGLSAQCNPERVRYIIVTDAAGVETTVQDPSGQKGCADDHKKRADGKGKQGRFYTSDFKDPDTGHFIDTIECDCGAVLRGFPQIERFLPPLGTPQAK